MVFWKILLKNEIYFKNNISFSIDRCSTKLSIDVNTSLLRVYACLQRLADN